MSKYKLIHDLNKINTTLKQIKREDKMSKCNTTESSNGMPCCGADLTFPDISTVENPKNPKDIITDDLLKEFEEDFKDFDIGYVNDLTGLFFMTINSNTPQNRNIH